MHAEMIQLCGCVCINKCRMSDSVSQPAVSLLYLSVIPATLLNVFKPAAVLQKPPATIFILQKTSLSYM